MRDTGQAGEQAAVDAALGGLDVWHETGDRVRAAFCCMNLGFSYYLRGEWLDAAELLEQALHELPEGSDDALAARSLVGTCQARLGEHLDAAENLARAAAGFVELGQLRRAGNDLIESGTALVLAERTEDAVERFSDAAELMERADWPYGVVVVLQHEARALMNSGDEDEAYEIATEAYDRARTLPESDAYEVGWVCADAADDVARILLELGRADDAFEQAAAGYQAAGDGSSAAAAQLLLAMLRVEVDDFTVAETTARKILADYEEIAAPDVLYRARAVLATALHGQGRDAESEKIWAELTAE
jgi:tetratricopeptide (TPR) repeat protein